MPGFQDVAPRPELTPDIVLGDLCVWASMKMGEAWENQQSGGNLTWFTRGSYEDSAGGRSPVVWYRLGEAHEISDDGRYERFDVGMVVADAQTRTEQPRVVLEPGSGFFVRKIENGDRIVGRVDVNSALQYAGIVEPSDKTVVTDLQSKLRDYLVQPMRVKQTPAA